MQTNNYLHCNAVEANTGRHPKKKKKKADKSKLPPKIFHCSPPRKKQKNQILEPSKI
jgi:hypothetical protein